MTKRRIKTKIGRWWYPARLSSDGKVEVYYPTKNPTWRNAEVVRMELNRRTKRKV